MTGLTFVSFLLLFSICSLPGCEEDKVEPKDEVHYNEAGTRFVAGRYCEALEDVLEP